MPIKLTRFRLLILNLIFLGIAIFSVLLSYFIFPDNLYLNPLYIVGFIFLSLWIGTGIWFWIWFFYRLIYREEPERERYRKYIRDPKKDFLSIIKSTTFNPLDEKQILKETNEPYCPYCGAILNDDLKFCERCKTKIVKNSKI